MGGTPYCCKPLFCLRVKTLVWFWIIDETLVLTSMLSVCRLVDTVFGHVSMIGEV